MEKKNGNNSEKHNETELENKDEDNHDEDDVLVIIDHDDVAPKSQEKILRNENEIVDGVHSSFSGLQETENKNEEVFGTEKTFEKTRIRKKLTKSHLRTRYFELQQEGKDLPQLSSPAIGSSADENMILNITPSKVPSAHCDGITQKFVSAQTRVLKEELQSIILECLEKNDLVSSLEKQLKLATSEKNKILRDISSKDALIEKYQRASDEHKLRADESEASSAKLKNEMESLRQKQKQLSTSKHSAETKLRQILQEVEQYKTDLRQMKQSANESSEKDKRKIEKLLMESKNLEKQKLELLSAFKKQQKLIENLKRQKLHLEAAKILEFTEQEFMKVLD